MASPPELNALPALVPVYKTIITWQDGKPIMTAEPVLTKPHIRALYMIVAAQPYEVTDPLDPDFGLYDGMTIAEVMVRKQLLKAARTGDVEEVMNRLIDKPMARGEQLNVNLDGSYEGYLKGLADKLAGGAAPIDAEVAEENIFGDLG